MTIIRALSCQDFPKSKRLEIDVCEAGELEMKLESFQQKSSFSTASEIESSLNFKGDEGESVWRMALQEALVDREQLMQLLRRYQRLVSTLKEQDYAAYSRALDCSFRRRASTDGGAAYPSLRTSTSVITDELLDMDNLVIKMESLKDHDALGRRRPSGTSSYLYAGVESTNAQSIKNYQELSVETVQVAPTVLKALNRMMAGSWLYKYPRRQYSKLIQQRSIPEGHLNYRYFWINPACSIVCWAPNPDSGIVKQVVISDFYTETRTLPRKEYNSNQKNTTIIILLTGEGKPLTIVPTTNEDLSLWISGLSSLLKLKKSKSWPDNIYLFTQERLH